MIRSSMRVRFVSHFHWLQPSFSIHSNLIETFADCKMQTLRLIEYTFCNNLNSNVIIDSSNHLCFKKLILFTSNIRLIIFEAKRRDFPIVRLLI